MMQGMQDEVDADTFWDAIDEDTTFTFHYHFPGFPHQMNKAEYKSWFQSYDAPETGADYLDIYRDKKNGVTTLVLDYVVHYQQGPDMHFLSIVKIEHKRVVQWDDFLNTSKSRR